MGSSDSDAGGDEGKGNMLPLIIGGVVVVAVLAIGGYFMFCNSSGGGVAGPVLAEVDKAVAKQKKEETAKDVSADEMKAAETAHKKIITDGKKKPEAGTAFDTAFSELKTFVASIKKDTDDKDITKAKDKYVEAAKKFSEADAEKKD